MRTGKADKDKKSVPVVVRLSKTEYEMIEKRSQTLNYILPLIDIIRRENGVRSIRPCLMFVRALCHNRR